MPSSENAQLLRSRYKLESFSVSLAKTGQLELCLGDCHLQQQMAVNGQSGFIDESAIRFLVPDLASLSNEIKRMHKCIISNGRNYQLAGHSSCQQLFARSTI